MAERKYLARRNCACAIRIEVVTTAIARISSAGRDLLRAWTRRIREHPELVKQTSADIRSTTTSPASNPPWEAAAGHLRAARVNVDMQLTALLPHHTRRNGPEFERTLIIAEGQQVALHRGLLRRRCTPPTR